MSISFRVLSRLSKRDDYAMLQFVTSAVLDVAFVYRATRRSSPPPSHLGSATSTLLGSLFASSSQEERCNALIYTAFNLVRCHALAILTNNLPEQMLVSAPRQSSSLLAVPKPQLSQILAFCASLQNASAQTPELTDRFDLVLCKRELTLMVLLFGRVGEFARMVRGIVRFEVEGLSLFIVVCLNYIALSNRMALVVPFFVLLLLLYIYYIYFRNQDGGQRTRGKCLSGLIVVQESIEARKRPKQKGIKRTMDRYKESFERFYAIVVKINTFLLRIQSSGIVDGMTGRLFTWVDPEKSKLFMLALLFVGIVCYFVPANVLLLVIVDTVFTSVGTRDSREA